MWGAPQPEPELPTLMRPDGDGYMPLFCAAHWIATNGGKTNFNAEDDEVWRGAFDELLAAISSERVKVVGLHGGRREKVPAETFAGIAVDYPFSDAPLSLMLGPSAYLRSYPYLDDPRWRNGFDDAIVSRQGDHWKQLVVEKGGVRARWPFDASPSAKSGAPGRPTSMHLVAAEFGRRVASGALADTLTGEAKALATWLKQTHSDSPPAGPGAIANHLRAKYRAATRTK